MDTRADNPSAVQDDRYPAQTQAQEKLRAAACEKGSPCGWRPDATSAKAQAWNDASKASLDQPLQINRGVYTVQPGDSLSTIAARDLHMQGQSATKSAIASEVQRIVEMNKDRYPSLDCNNALVRDGWKLHLPSGDQIAQPAPAPQPPAERYVAPPTGRHVEQEAPPPEPYRAAPPNQAYDDRMAPPPPRYAYEQPNPLAPVGDALAGIFGGIGLIFGGGDRYHHHGWGRDRGVGLGVEIGAGAGVDVGIGRAGLGLNLGLGIGIGRGWGIDPGYYEPDYGYAYPAYGYRHAYRPAYRHFR